MITSIVLSLVGLVLASFTAAFIDGTLQQRRQNERDRQAHEETARWLREHGQGL